ncbi:MAG: hypothetical protein ACOCUZ_00375, partial [bacterium]
MSRVRVILSTLIPGVLPFLRGRRITGGVAFFTWLAVLALGAHRWDRLAAFLSGPLDGQIAVATLAAVVLGAMVWSGRETALQESEREAAAWQRADRQDADGKKPSGAGPRAPIERWGPTVRAFRRNKLAVAGLIAVGIFYLAALLTPLLAPFDPTAQAELVGGSNLPPTWEHPLGTDQYARDVLSRLLYGARISLTVGFVAVAIFGLPSMPGRNLAVRGVGYGVLAAGLLVLALTPVFVFDVTRACKELIARLHGARTNWPEARRRAAVLEGRSSPPPEKDGGAPPRLAERFDAIAGWLDIKAIAGHASHPDVLD